MRTFATYAAILVAVIAVGYTFVRLYRQPESAYAHNQVQALFVNAAGRPTAKVERCLQVGSGTGPGEEVWACRIRGLACGGTFKFVVDHEYGTFPYDALASEATVNVCRATR